MIGVILEAAPHADKACLGSVGGYLEHVSVRLPRNCPGTSRQVRLEVDALNRKTHRLVLLGTTSTVHVSRHPFLQDVELFSCVE